MSKAKTQNRALMNLISIGIIFMTSGNELEGWRGRKAEEIRKF